MRFYNPRDFIGVLGLNKPLVWRAAVVLSMSMKNRRASEKQLARAEVRRKPKNRHRNRGFAAEEIDNLSDALFKEMFRINREAFEYIETLLDARIVRDAQKAKNSSGSVISSWESIQLGMISSRSILNFEADSFPFNLLSSTHDTQQKH